MTVVVIISVAGVVKLSVSHCYSSSAVLARVLPR